VNSGVEQETSPSRVHDFTPFYSGFVLLRVPLVKQELFILPEVTPMFNRACVTLSLALCAMLCRSLFGLFHLAIVLSVLLKFTILITPYNEGILPFKMIGYFEDTKGVIRIVNLSRTDNTMAN
jgi:hypothetical protein